MSSIQDAIATIYQNIVDNGGEKRIEQSSFKTEANSASDLAALIREANNAGVDVNDLLGTAKKKRRTTGRM